MPELKWNSISNHYLTVDNLPQVTIVNYNFLVSISLISYSFYDPSVLATMATDVQIFESSWTVYVCKRQNKWA